MGNSNIICSVSNVCIMENDLVYLLPIRPTKPIKRNNSVRPSLTSDYLMESSIGAFIPSLMPIKGVYDGYGKIKCSEKTENIKYLEKQFNMPIEDIIEIITCDRNKDLFDSCSGPSKVFVLKRHNYEYYPSKVTKEFLTQIGFISEQNIFSKKDIPNTVISLSETEIYVISSEWIELINNDRNGTINLLKCLYEKFNIYAHLNEQDLKNYDILKEMSCTFIHGDIYEVLSKYSETEFKQTKEDIQKELKNLIDNGLKISSHSNALIYDKGYDTSIEYFKIYYKLFENNDISSEVIHEYLSFTKFKNSLLRLGIKYMISSYGSQDSSNPLRKTLIEESLKIIENQLIKKEDEDEYEE